MPTGWTQSLTSTLDATLACAIRCMLPAERIKAHAIVWACHKTNIYKRTRCFGQMYPKQWATAVVEIAEQPAQLQS